ncbi:MAG: nuclear transport factor 2 family protein [Planctomycetes bacterium]|nr:nuclear transport factor 2 family protein [Planctomycetota bacterium]NUQ34284.1 nuclear transport factor 2 family protein [Planctomycetaceae bacterium]
MKLRPDVPAVIQLSDEQLAAYNAADTGRFCACYHENVKVLDMEGNVTLSGIAAFRDRYGKLFTEWKDVRADIVGRLHLANHSVELEIWRRTNPQTGETLTGQIIVRYTEMDGKLAIVQFLK